MTTLIVFILVLGVLIFVHELGHFLSAKKLGVGVEEFGFGYPPRIFGIKVNKKATGKKWQFFWGDKIKKEDNLENEDSMIYSLNLLPLGGFVKIIGENGQEDDNPKNFSNQAAWKRVIVLSAGVIMNFILAIVLLSIGFYFGLPQTIEPNTPSDKVSNRNVVVVEVLPNSPAEEQGIKINDVIVSINGQAVSNSDEIFEKIKVNSELTLGIERNKQKQDIKLTPRVLPDRAEPLIGVAMVDTGIVRYGFFGSIWQGLRATYILSIRVLEALYSLLANIITQGKLSADLSGPIGVAVITGQVAQMGFIYLLQFAAILSINLGIINIVPFPALDGGRLLFILIEKIRRKKMNQKIENILHNSGFILLMILVVFITYRDVMRYGQGFLTRIKDLF